VSTQFLKAVNTRVNQTWNHLLPSPCTLCGDSAKNGEIICPECKSHLPTNPIGCPRCALPMPRAELCGRCQRTPPAFDQAIAPLIYSAPIDSLISQLKYNHRLATGRTFTGLLEQKITATGSPLPDAIIAMPLHRLRLKQRGFNQSLEIARPLARLINRPLLTNLVQRHKATAPQTGLTGAARRKNLRGAFSVTAPPTHRHLAVVDDVMTTGSTAQELATTLKRSGVDRIDIWVIARVDRPASGRNERPRR